MVAVVAATLGTAGIAVRLVRALRSSRPVTAAKAQLATARVMASPSATRSVPVRTLRIVPMAAVPNGPSAAVARAGVRRARKARLC